MKVEALMNTIYWLGVGTNGIKTNATLQYDSVGACILDLATRFPLRDLAVALEQHNRAGIDIRCAVREPGEIPANRYRHSVTFEAYVSRQGQTPDDAFWAEVVCALRGVGAEVDPGRSPSERAWITGLLCNIDKGGVRDEVAHEQVRKAIAHVRVEGHVRGSEAEGYYAEWVDQDTGESCRWLAGVGNSPALCYTELRRWPFGSPYASPWSRTGTGLEVQL